MDEPPALCSLAWVRGATGQFSCHTGAGLIADLNLWQCSTDALPLTGKRFHLVWIRVQLHPVLVCSHGLSAGKGWGRARTSLCKQVKCLTVWKLELDQFTPPVLQCSDKIGKMHTQRKTQVTRWDFFAFFCALVFCLSDPDLVKCILMAVIHTNPSCLWHACTCTAMARKVVPIHKEGFSLVNM